MRKLKETPHKDEYSDLEDEYSDDSFDALPPPPSSPPHSPPNNPPSSPHSPPNSPPNNPPKRTKQTQKTIDQMFQKTPKQNQTPKQIQTPKQKRTKQTTIEQSIRAAQQRQPASSPQSSQLTEEEIEQILDHYKNPLANQVWDQGRPVLSFEEFLSGAPLNGVIPDSRIRRAYDEYITELQAHQTRDREFQNYQYSRTALQLNSLRPGRLVEVNVLDAYLQLLDLQAPNSLNRRNISYRILSGSFGHWIYQQNLNQISQEINDLLKNFPKFVMFPYLVHSNHWMLAWIEHENHHYTIHMYDPKQNPVTNELNKIKQLLHSKNISSQNITTIEEKGPKQGQTNDCGVFVMEWVRNMFFNGNYRFSQQKILSKKVRERIRRELENQQLEPFEQEYHASQPTSSTSPRSSASTSSAASPRSSASTSRHGSQQTVQIDNAFDIVADIPDLGTLTEGLQIDEHIVNAYFKLLKNQSRKCKKNKKILVLPMNFYLSLELSDPHNQYPKEMQLFAKGTPQQTIYQALSTTYFGKKTMNDFDEIIFPCRVDNPNPDAASDHWIVIRIDNYDSHPIIITYDSMNLAYDAVIDNINKFRDFQQISPITRNYQYGTYGPKQINTNDCGAFAMQYGKFLLQGGDLNWIEEDMPDIRKRIEKELVQQKLIPGQQYKGLKLAEKMIMKDIRPGLSADQVKKQSRIFATLIPEDSEDKGVIKFSTLYKKYQKRKDHKSPDQYFDFHKQNDDAKEISYQFVDTSEDYLQPLELKAKDPLFKKLCNTDFYWVYRQYLKEYVACLDAGKRYSEKAPKTTKSKTLKKKKN